MDDKYGTSQNPSPPPPRPNKTQNVLHRFDKYKHLLQIKKEFYNEHYNKLLLLAFNFEYPLTS
jgi:hypothetical protein